MKPNILLIDDDRQNSGLLLEYLAAKGFVVEYAPDGVSGLRMWQSAKPDLILLDIGMPGIDGFEVAAKIRKEDTRTAIFFLTDRTEKADRLKGFALKGNDYIPKPFYPEELIARINERFNSAITYDYKEYRLGNTLFKPSQSSVTYAGKTHSLTVRQSEILTILAENTGVTVDRDAILQRVWGDTSYANSLAMNVQITYIRKLLEDPSVTISTVKRKGYLLKTV